MQRFRALAAAFAFLVASVSADEVISASTNFTSILRPLWNMADANADGELSRPEFNDAVTRLGIPATIFTEHQQNVSILFTDLDTDADNGLTIPEFTNAASRYSVYKDPLIKAFTNGAGEVPTTVPKSTSPMKTANARLDVRVKLSGSIGDIYPGMRDSIKAYFARAANVDVDAVVITFLPGSVIAEANIYVANASAADEAISALPTSAAEYNALPEFSGLVVVEDPSYELTEDRDLDFALVCAVGGGALLLGLAWCCVAGACARRRARHKDVPLTSPCCLGAGCSTHAIRPWASSALLSVALLGGSLAYLYYKMDGMQDVFIGLIDALLELQDSTVSAVRDFFADLPQSAVNQIERNRSRAELLRVAALAPGASACAVLLLMAACSCSSRRQGSYCCTKFLALCANLLLVISAAFYVIFAVFAVVVRYAPEDLDRQIRDIRSTCVVIPATVNQLFADNRQALATLAASGQNVTELLAEIDELSGLRATLDRACELLDGFFAEMEELFAPGIICCVAIVFAMLANNAVCCAAGCCGRPATRRKDFSMVDLASIRVNPDTIVST